MTWWCCHTWVPTSAHLSSLTFTTRPSSFLYFIVLLVPFFFFFSFCCAGCATHTPLRIKAKSVSVSFSLPCARLSAHLPACLSVCLPLTASLAVTTSGVIGIRRSAHDLIQRRALAGCLEIDLASKMWRGVKPAISVLSATLDRFAHELWQLLSTTKWLLHLSSSATLSLTCPTVDPCIPLLGIKVALVDLREWITP